MEKAKESEEEGERDIYPPVADGFFLASNLNPVIPVFNRVTARRQYKEFRAKREDLDPHPPKKKRDKFFVPHPPLTE